MADDPRGEEGCPPVDNSLLDHMDDHLSRGESDMFTLGGNPQEAVDWVVGSMGHQGVHCCHEKLVENPRWLLGAQQDVAMDDIPLHGSSDQSDW